MCHDDDEIKIISVLNYNNEGCHVYHVFFRLNKLEHFVWPIGYQQNDYNEFYLSNKQNKF